MSLKPWEEIVLAVVAASISGENEEFCKWLPLSAKRWNRVIEFAESQGVIGLVLEQVEKLPQPLLPPMDELMELVGQQEYQRTQFKLRLETASRFADELKKEGIGMVVLKGLAFSKYWEQPDLRESCDVDCWLKTLSDSPLKGENASSIGDDVARRMGAEVDDGYYKHSHIHFQDVMIENHRYLTDFNETKRGMETERLLRLILKKEGCSEYAGTSLLIPNDHFNILFLLKHAQGHFMSEGLSLRMLYDWACVLKAIEDGRIKVDMERLQEEIRMCHMERLERVLTRVVTEFLGVKSSLECKGCIDSKESMVLLADTFRERKEDRKVTPWDSARRFVKRMYRRWRFRKLDSENFLTTLKNGFIFNSYVHKEVNVEF